MNLNESMTKTQLVDKAKELARKYKIAGGIAVLLLFVLGGVLTVKGTPQQAQATFEIGGQILTAVFENDKVAIVSATAPVSVTVVSGSEIVSSSDINTFVDGK